MNMPEQAESTIDPKPTRNPEKDDNRAAGRCSDSEPSVDQYDPEFDRDYVPDGIHISEERRKELQIEHERYLAQLIEKVGEPTTEEVARSKAWWRPIREHLTKDLER